jgi:hypothetical protein
VDEKNWDRGGKGFSINTGDDSGIRALCLRIYWCQNVSHLYFIVRLLRGGSFSFLNAKVQVENYQSAKLPMYQTEKCKTIKV